MNFPLYYTVTLSNFLKFFMFTLSFGLSLESSSEEKEAEEEMQRSNQNFEKKKKSTHINFSRFYAKKTKKKKPAINSKTLHFLLVLC